jgi:hypothetical protein
MRWLLKSQFDQNYHLINYTPYGDFKSYFIFLWTFNVHVELFLKLPSNCQCATQATNYVNVE